MVRWFLKITISSGKRVLFVSGKCLFVWRLWMLLFSFFLLMLWLQKRKKSIGAHYFTHTLMMMFCSEWMPNIGTICIYMCLLGKEFCNFSTKGNHFFHLQFFFFLSYLVKKWGIVMIFSFLSLLQKFYKGKTQLFRLLLWVTNSASTSRFLL